MKKEAEVISVLNSDNMNAGNGIGLVICIVVIAAILTFALMNLFQNSKTAI